MQTIKVSLDGGATFVVAGQGVRVIIDGIPIGDGEAAAELHLNVTDEGVITDVIDTDGQNAGTDSAMFAEIVERLAQSGLEGMPSEDEVADFWLGCIEDGQLSLEDIPDRLARYGLMEPGEFVEELRERGFEGT